MKNKLIIAMVVFCVSISGYAADVTWKNAVNGTFSDGANWSTGNPPGTADTARFSNAGDYTVDFTSSAQNTRAYVEASSGTVTFDVGSGREYYLSNGMLIENTSGGVTNNIISGKVRLNNVFIRKGYCKMIVSNLGTELEATGGLNICYGVADDHDNSLLVTNGALVTSVGSLTVGSTGGSTNECVISGAGSKMTVGSNIEIGHSFTSDSNTVKVEDGATLVASSSEATTYVGASGATSYNNSLIVQGGSCFTNMGKIYVGYSDGENNFITVDESDLTCIGSLYVGYNAMNNSVDISNGAYVFSDGNLFIGTNSGSDDNSLSLTGAGTKMYLDADASVGFRQGVSGNSLSISDGAEFDVKGTLKVGGDDTCFSNIVSVSNGSLVNTNGTFADCLIQNDSYLEVSGSNSDVQLRYLDVISGSTLKLLLGDTGFNPIAVNVRVTYDTTTKLDVDATEYAQAGGGDITVLTANYLTGTIDPANMTLVPEGTTATVGATGSITLNVPDMSTPGGTVFIVN